MCGLAGYSGANKSNFMVIKEFLKTNQSRGSHSTGYAFINDYRAKRKVKVYKTTDAAKTMVKSSFHNENFKANEFIGHTRYATMGEHTTENAHPFVFGAGTEDALVGTHNGWLLGSGLPKEYDEHTYEAFLDRMDYPDFAVDSMAIFYHMWNTKDITAFKDIEGAMALAFIYKDSLYLYRRESKPLFVRVDKGEIHYSSLADSFVESFGLDHGAEMLKPNVLFQFKKGELVSETEIPEPKVKINLDEVPSRFKARVTPSYSSRNYSEFYKGGSEDYSCGTQSTIFESENEDSAYQNFRKELRGIIGPSRLPHFNNQSMINVFNHSINDDEILSCLGYQIKKPEALTMLKNKSIDPNQSTVVIKILNNDEDKTPMNRFRCVWDGGAEVFETNKDGVAGVRVPKLVLQKGQGRLLLHPPNGCAVQGKNGEYRFAKSYYYIDIKGVTKGQVLEVACSIPFLQEQEKAEEESCFVALPPKHGEYVHFSSEVCPEEDSYGFVESEEQERKEKLAKICCAYDEEQKTYSTIDDHIGHMEIHMIEPDPKNMEHEDINRLESFLSDSVSIVHLCDFHDVDKSSTGEVLDAIGELGLFIDRYDDVYPTAYYAADLKFIASKYANLTEKIREGMWLNVNQDSQKRKDDYNGTMHALRIKYLKEAASAIMTLTQDIHFCAEEAKTHYLNKEYDEHVGI